MSRIEITGRNPDGAKRVTASILAYKKVKLSKLQDIVYDATNTQTNEAKARVQVDTGNTKANIYDRFEDDGLTGLTFTTTKVSRWLEFGTSPHIIRAKKAKSLRFMAGGKMIFAKYVNHPGTKPYPFLRPSHEVAAAQMEDDIRREVRSL